VNAAPVKPVGGFVLEAPAAGQLVARGPLTFATARAARLAGLAVLAAAAAQPPLVMDCSAVSAADSAGLAVLLDWLAAAKAAGQQLRFTGLPAGFAALAHISDLTELLDRGV
jgi:phospholipid transport system transporter-binding protein